MMWKRCRRSISRGSSSGSDDDLTYPYDPMPFLFDFVSARSPGFSHKLWFSRGLMRRAYRT